MPHAAAALLFYVQQRTTAKMQAFTANETVSASSMRCMQSWWTQGLWQILLKSHLNDGNAIGKAR